MSSKNKVVTPTKKGKASESVFTIDKKVVRLLSFILIVFSFCLYVNTFNHGYVLDDHSVIRENTLTKGGVKNIGEILKSPYRDGFGANGNDLYRPLSKVMFAIEWEFSPNNAKLGHIMNVLLYSFTCFLLFLVLVRYIKINIYILFSACLLFAVHPIHTEVVANIKSRDEILAMIFLLTSLLFIHKYITNNKKVSLVISLVSFFLALLSKESAIVYVGIVFIVIHFFSELPLKKNIIITASFAAISFIYILIHLKIIGNLGIPNVPLVDNSIVGHPLNPSSFMEKRLTAIYILGKYLWLLFFPHPLSSDYSYSTIPLIAKGAPVEAFIGCILSFLFHAFLLIYSLKKFKSKTLLSFCILFYLISISITSNVFMIIGTNMAERLLYFPSLAFCLAIAILGAKAFKIDFNASLNKLSQVFKANTLMTFLILVVTIVFSVKTFSRNKDWLSDGTLFNTDVEKVPNSAHMLYYTANHLMNKDSLKIKFDDKINAAKSAEEKQSAENAKATYIAKADELIKRALKIYDLFPDALNVAGRISYERKQYQEALAYYTRALELNPAEVMNHNNIGTCYFNTGKLDDALREFKIAVQKNSKDVDAQNNLGSAYGAMGENYKTKNDFVNAKLMFDSAIYQFNKTLELDPNYKSAHQFLGFTYRNLGDTITANKYFKQAELIK